MDKSSGRYKVPESEDFEPGSNDSVLKNHLRIKSADEMNLAEYQEYQRTQDELSEIFDKDHKFTEIDICNIHDLWLADIYPFAGNYRTVTMGKEGYSFAAPNLIPNLMKDFSDECLCKYTPCNYKDIDELSNALGVVHVELIIIHPFREGNGRTARLLADLMSMQAEKPPLDYSSIDQNKNIVGFQEYIKAIHAGHCKNYGPIVDVFRKLLLESVDK